MMFHNTNYFRSVAKAAVVLLALVSAITLNASAPSKANAQELVWVKVYVRIWHVSSWEETDSDGTEGDLYLRLRIERKQIEFNGPMNDDNIRVNWGVGEWFQVPRSELGGIGIVMTLRDYDRGKNRDEDIDISPVAGNTERILVLQPLKNGGDSCELRDGEQAYNPFIGSGTWASYGGRRGCIIHVTPEHPRIAASGDGNDPYQGNIVYSISVALD